MRNAARCLLKTRTQHHMMIGNVSLATDQAICSCEHCSCRSRLPWCPLMKPRDAVPGGGDACGLRRCDLR
eukprot:9503513-Pyramimonas_sp.AAC.1